MNYSPAIVVVAFNRPKNLKKLLKYLEKASFKNEFEVSLVISIDYQDSDGNMQVRNIAEKFNWKYGKKRIIAHTKNLGLREHILKCGDLTQEYGAIILLEDDVLVAPSFYEYATRAANHYSGESTVAGISLYAYEYEELGLFRFYPKNLGSDTYFMQWAASWGQLWTDNQWNGFRDWYAHKKDIKKINIPDRVKNWSKSWKKFYIAYLVDQDKFFVYPYLSFTTLTEDLGTHIKSDAQVNNVFISNMETAINIRFSDISKEELKYDCFFQPLERHVFIESLGKEVYLSFDMFGTKSINDIRAEYVFTTKKSTMPIQKNSNKLIPYELNLIYNEPGDILVFSKKNNLSENNSILGKSKLQSNFRKKNSVKNMLLIVFGKVFRKVFKF